MLISTNTMLLVLNFQSSYVSKTFRKADLLRLNNAMKKQSIATEKRGNNYKFNSDESSEGYAPMNNPN